MGKIRILGLGAGDIDQLPLGIYRALKDSETLFVRTSEHPVLEQLQNEVAWTSFDSIYEENETFEAVYEQIVERLLHESEKGAITYAVPGHPLVAETTVQLLIEAEKKGLAELQIDGGQSFLDPIFNALRIDPIDGFQLLDGTTLQADQVNMKQHILIGQVYDAFSASDVKLTLLEKYDPETPVTIVTAAGSSKEQITTVPLVELDRHVELSNLTTVYVPPISGQELRLKEWATVRSIIRELRDPETGCPWDIKQTHESLKPYMIEEAHELLQAIDEEDDDQIVGELGDVLLQVLLHAQIGEDNGYFAMEDVFEALASKMIRRHPHVFGDREVADADEVVSNWQEIKKQEKGATTKTLLDGQNRASSSLLTSFNYQNEAAKVGFNWNDIEGAMEKFEEEWSEFKEAIHSMSKDDQLDELGDVLATIVNVARFANLSPEEAMWMANNKFYRRFGYVEKSVKEGKGDFSAYTLEELDAFWNEAKKLERKGNNDAFR